jgi:small subunit ribosomal protein S20
VLSFLRKRGNPLDRIVQRATLSPRLRSALPYHSGTGSVKVLRGFKACGTVCFAMPIKKASIKDLKQSKARQDKNRRVKTSIRRQIKELRSAAKEQDKKKASDILAKTIKAMDTAVSNGVLKKNTAARNISRLTKLVNGLKKI